MRKIILNLFLLATVMVFLSACKKDTPFLGAKVNVAVKNLLEMPVTGKTVYLYKNVEPTKDTKPSSADYNVVTDIQGVASFRLNLTQLNILEAQTTLYFVVFYTVNNVTFIAGTGAVTVKRDDNKDLSINIPI